jgi:hypothetical protein
LHLTFTVSNGLSNPEKCGFLVAPTPCPAAAAAMDLLHALFFPAFFPAFMGLLAGANVTAIVKGYQKITASSLGELAVSVRLC